MDNRKAILIKILENKLKETDYKEFKNIRGEYSEGEWEVISKERKLWIAQINELRK